MLRSACLLLWLLPLQAAPAVKKTPDTVSTAALRALFRPEPPRPDWMQADKALQAPVTLEAKGQPLRVVLNALSQQSGATIHAARDLQEFRVVINVRSQPLWKLMARLENLWGHGQVPSHSCIWQRGGQAGKITYFFARTQRGREEEEEELNRPLRMALMRLRERRDYARLNPEQRQQFHSDDPAMQDTIRKGLPLADNTKGLIYKAVASLSDDQIKTLAREGEISVTDFTVSSETAAWLLKEIPHDNSSLMDNQDMRLPSDALLTFGREEAWKGMYALNLCFRSGYPRRCPGWVGLDTHDLFAMPEALEAEASVEADVVDLLDEEKVPLGKQPIVSLPTALNVLARKAHINIYAESFVHPQKALRFPKGSPSYILTHLCADFGCRWLKVGGDYLVYSKSWAEDRAADISQPELDNLLAKRAKQGRYELQDYIKMAGRNDLQIKTLEDALSISGPFGGGNKNALRLLNALNSNDLPVAYSAEGALLTELTPANAPDLQAVFGKRPVTPPVRVKLENTPTGVTIQFADAQGKSRQWWAYQGDKEPAQAGPGRYSLSEAPRSRLQPDGSYLPPWL